MTTDGFLYPNRGAGGTGLVARKGFPESYDSAALMTALRSIRSGAGEVAVPVYSHAAYDIVADRTQLVRSPDIVILEGLNVLQVHGPAASPDGSVVSDYLDTSVYVDAAEGDLGRWFHRRLLALRGDSGPVEHLPAVVHLTLGRRGRPGGRPDLDDGQPGQPA